MHKAFHALKEKCSLDKDTLFRFRDRCQLPNETRIRLPRLGEKVCSFTPGEVSFYKASFVTGLRFLVHPFIMELLYHLGIAPRQLKPNSWRIIISCMEIWMTVIEGDMIFLDEFVFLYHLKESKEFEYYKLVPWDRKSKLVLNLPSYFRYWDSRYYFMFGDSWETLSDNF